MTIEINYICDTCRSKVTKEYAVAVVFKGGGNQFTLWESNTQAFHEHKGIHVCKSCLDQYRNVN